MYYPWGFSPPEDVLHTRFRPRASPGLLLALASRNGKVDLRSRIKLSLAVVTNQSNIPNRDLVGTRSTQKCDRIFASEFFGCFMGMLRQYNIVFQNPIAQLRAF